MTEGNLAKEKPFLENALAFRDNGEEVFKDACVQVKRLSESGPIYPPKSYPTTGRREPRATIGLQKNSWAGQLTQVEAVAVSILHTEVTALAQAFGISFEISVKLSEAMHLTPNDWSGDVIAGLGDFGDFLGMAAGVREYVLAGGERPDGKTMVNKAAAYWWDAFHDHILVDNFVLGETVCSRTVTLVEEMASRNIPCNKGEAGGNSEAKQRIKSAVHGAELGKKLYLEVYGKAADENFSTTLAREVEATILQKPVLPKPV